MNEYVMEVRYDQPELPAEVLDCVRSHVQQLIAPERLIDRMFSNQRIQVSCPMCNQKIMDLLELTQMTNSGLCHQCTAVQDGRVSSWIYYREPTLIEIGEELGAGFFERRRTLSRLESLVILRHLEQLGAPLLEILHGQWKDRSYTPVDMLLAGVCMHCILLGERDVEEYTVSRTSMLTGITYTNLGCRKVANRWFPDLEKA